MNYQAAFGHIINPTGSFLPYRPHPWPLARCRSVPCFLGRFGRVFATGATDSRTVATNGDDRLRSLTPVVVGRGVLEGHVSILTRNWKSSKSLPG
ncbi:hypothetical protein O9993_05605 [Vibrio lentus]|nr:hypothetical protein [Vibrio lentus]